MRWFAARREPVFAISASPARAGRRILRTALLALACLAGVGFSAGERFQARAADDGGMMSFLLGGNSGGRARAAAPQFRFDPPAFKGRAPAARAIALSWRKAKPARTTRHAFARHRAKRPDPAMAASGARGLIQKASYETSADIADQKTIARTLALKAAAAAARPDDAHLMDKTLRRGDIVATAAGLRVFRGSERFPYRPHDFAPISAARHVAQRPVLEALDRSLRGVRLVARSQIQKRVAKVEDRPRVSGAAEVRRVEARPPASAAQTIALAYAPRAGSGEAKAATPAMTAIERVVRRVDAAPPSRSDRAAIVGRPAKAAATQIE